MYSSFLKRVIAFIIDLVIIGLLLGTLNSFLSQLLHRVIIAAFANNGAMAEFIFDRAPFILYIVPFITIIFDLLLCCLIFSLFDFSKGQGTIGKRILKIKISTINGNKLSFSKAFIRNLLKLFSIFTIVGPCMALFTKKKQSLHDILTDTLVINTSTDTSNFQFLPSSMQTKGTRLVLLVLFVFIAYKGCWNPLLNNIRKQASYQHKQETVLKSLPPPPVVDDMPNRTEQESLSETKRIVSELIETLDKYVQESGKSKLGFQYATFNVGTHNENYSIQSWVDGRGYIVQVDRGWSYFIGTNIQGKSVTVIFNRPKGKDRECRGAWGEDEETQKLCDLLQSPDLPDSAVLAKEREDYFMLRNSPR